MSMSEDDYWRFKDDLDEASDLWFITRNRLLVDPGLPPHLAETTAEIAVQKQFHVSFTSQTAKSWLKQYPRHPINNPCLPPQKIL